MNNAILINSLKHLTHRFVTVSKLSRWLQETLVIIHYTDKKLYMSMIYGDLKVVEQLLPLVQDTRVIDTSIDQILNLGPGLASYLTDIIMLIYTKEYTYKSLEVFDHACDQKNLKLIKHFLDLDIMTDP